MKIVKALLGLSVFEYLCKKPVFLQWIVVIIFFLLSVLFWLSVTTENFYLYILVCLILLVLYVTGAKFNFLLRLHFYTGPDISEIDQDLTKKRILHEQSIRFAFPIGHFILLPIRSSVVTYILISDLSIFYKFLFIPLVIFITGKYVVLLTNIESRCAQLRRDLTSNKIIEDIKFNKSFSESFCIYLRPFSITGKQFADSLLRSSPDNKKRSIREALSIFRQTGKIDLDLIGWLPVLSDQFAESERNPEWEMIIETAYRPYGRFMGLGKPGETLGAGRIKTEDTHWKKTFETLATKAERFFVMPSLKKGTRWELEWLKRKEKYRNCIFIMPGHEIGPDFLKQWNDMRSELEPIFRFPPHQGHASLFMYNKDDVPFIIPIVKKGFYSKGKAMWITRKKWIRKALYFFIYMVEANNPKNADKSSREELKNVLKLARETVEFIFKHTYLKPTEILKECPFSKGVDEKAMADLCRYIEGFGSVISVTDDMYVSYPILTINYAINVRILVKCSSADIVTFITIIHANEGKEILSFHVIEKNDEEKYFEDFVKRYR